MQALESDPIFLTSKTLQASLEHRRGMMVSPPDSIPILQLLLKLTKAKKVVEVGVFTGSSSFKSFVAVLCMKRSMTVVHSFYSTGYTSLGMALALPDDGRLYSLDITDEYPSIGRPPFNNLLLLV